MNNGKRAYRTASPVVLAAKLPLNVLLEDALCTTRSRDVERLQALQTDLSAASPGQRGLHSGSKATLQHLSMEL